MLSIRYRYREITLSHYGDDTCHMHNLHKNAFKMVRSSFNVLQPSLFLHAQTPNHGSAIVYAFFYTYHPQLH